MSRERRVYYVRVGGRTMIVKADSPRLALIVALQYELNDADFDTMPSEKYRRITASVRPVDDV